MLVRAACWLIGTTGFRLSVTWEDGWRWFRHAMRGQWLTMSFKSQMAVLRLMSDA